MSVAYKIGEAQLDGRPPIVAIHGAGGDKSAWQAVQRLAGSHWPLLALDLPGHGASDGESCDTVRGYLAQVIAL